MTENGLRAAKKMRMKYLKNIILNATLSFKRGHGLVSEVVDGDFL